MSVGASDRYRQAFRTHLLGEPLTEAQRAVLEAGREEAALPPGRYPPPCGTSSAATPTGTDETAAVRFDGPAAAAPRRTRWGGGGTEER